MVLGGVEVDVVGDLERQVQRHLGERQQQRGERVPVGLVGQPAGQRGADRGPHRAAGRQQRVERVRVEQDGGLPGGPGGGACVEDEVADPDADPPHAGPVGRGEDAVRQVVHAERRVVRGGEPAAGGGQRSSWGVRAGDSRPRAARSSRGSAMLQVPKAVNELRITVT